VRPGRFNSELESCGVANYGSGCWTLPVLEFFRETRITHFSKVKCSGAKTQSTAASTYPPSRYCRRY